MRNYSRFASTSSYETLDKMRWLPKLVDREIIERKSFLQMESKMYSSGYFELLYKISVLN